MPTVVGIRLRFSKTLWFNPQGLELAEGDLVIVETERGNEVGTVVQPPHEVEDAQLPAPLKPVVRSVNDEDRAQLDELAEKEREALPVFRELVAEHKLEMKPIDVEYLPGGDKVVFYFSADERVDFRDLVKDLASRFHARIDMRQVGVRDEARMVGGLGHCGQMLCCVRFGGEFQPVSIRMAKEQDLPLNPLKISGLCGRLMCCLRYEFDAYKDFKSRAPKRGAIIDTPAGLAKVTEMNTPRETVTVRFEDGNRVTVPLGSMSCAKGSGCPCQISKESLDEAMGTVAIEFPAEPEVAPAKGKQKPKPPSSGGEGSGKSGSAAPESASSESAPKERTRRRRRRGSRGGQDQSGPEAGAKDAPPKAAEPQGAKPAGDAGSGQAQGAGGTSSSGRRRRRRRRSGGADKPPASE